MNIHITRDGQEYGPYGLEETRNLFQAGQLLASDLAWHDGLEGWTTLGELLAVSGGTPPPVPADGVSESLKAKTSKSALVLRIVLVVILVAVGSVVGLDHLARGKHQSAYEYLEAEYEKMNSATPDQVAKELGRKPVFSKRVGQQLHEQYEWKGPLKIYKINLVFTVYEKMNKASIDDMTPEVKWRFADGGSQNAGGSSGPDVAGEYVGPGAPGGPGGPGPVPFGGSEESSTEYDDNWMTDLPAAIQLAKKENKHVFVDFTGSDWCPPCKALHRNVLTKQAFLDYAKNNLVLVVLDFPRNRLQPDSLKRANQALSQKYRVGGFPTVMLMDGNEKILHRESGYSGNSAADYVANLKTKVSQ